MAKISKKKRSKMVLNFLKKQNAKISKIQKILRSK